MGHVSNSTSMIMSLIIYHYFCHFDDGHQVFNNQNVGGSRQETNKAICLAAHQKGRTRMPNKNSWNWEWKNVWVSKNQGTPSNFPFLYGSSLLSTWGTPMTMEPPYIINIPLIIKYPIKSREINIKSL